MLELKGKYNNAKIYTNNIEETAISQIINLCNQKFTENSKIRIMSDVHAGVGCTIGTTMTLIDKVVPNLVGVDIGCGMLCVNLKLNKKDIDLNNFFTKVDAVINNHIPYGQNIRKTNHKFNNMINLDELNCKNYINIDRAEKSIGTLGGGNHFIEIDENSKGELFLVIHSGSRYLGKQVAEYYQNIAIKNINNNKEEKKLLIQKLKSERREKEIQFELKKISNKEKTPKDLCYLEGKNFENYLHDMDICQKYASINRFAMAVEILDKFNIDLCSNSDNFFTTIHNYIDIKNKILRKGAVSAQLHEKLIIPMNMRDGSLICVGKGNEDWNFSAPHGAGRIMSRSKAKESVSLKEFEDSMNGIYSTSVCESTIDESPMAYKPMQEIIDNVKDTVNIVDIIKPIYNFKAK